MLAHSTAINDITGNPIQITTATHNIYIKYSMMVGGDLVNLSSIAKLKSLLIIFLDQAHGDRTAPGFLRLLDIMHGYDPSKCNEMHPQLQPKKTKARLY